MSHRDDIHEFFHPRAVALIGPLNRRLEPERILSPLRARWGDAFRLVDADGGSIGSTPVYRDVAEIPGAVDLGVLAVPAGDVLDTVEACGERQLRNLIVSTDFAPLGAEGTELERRIVRAVRSYGMRMLGPNANANSFDAMDPPVHPRIGKIGLITQSGHMGRVIFQSSAHGVAFSRWVPTGSEADLDASDFIEYFACDEETAVVAAYLEGIRDPTKLRRALAAAAEMDTPVVVIKVGRHDAAVRMAVSHTGHITGSDAIVAGLFKQYAVVRVDDVDELIETAALHAKLRPAPRKGRVGLYGISGGALALMADHAEAQGVPVPVLGEETQSHLRTLLPPHLGVTNPVDNGNLYRRATAEPRREIIRTIAEDPAVDLLVCALTGFIPGLTDDYAGDILDYAASGGTPVVATWNTWEMAVDAYNAVVRSGIPVFRSFRGCFRALAGYFERQRLLASARARPVGTRPSEFSTGDAQRASPLRTIKLLRRYGIPLVEERRVETAAEASQLAVALGMPVVLKSLLSDYPHKSDAGLVRTDISSPEDAEEAYVALRRRTRDLAPSGDPEIIIQPQLDGVAEVIIGVTSDPTLGKALLLGLGGIFAEVVRDVSIRPLPVTKSDVDEMLGELRGRELLDGARGQPAGDISALTATALAVAELADDPRNAVVELDLNPVIVRNRGVVVVDHLLYVASDSARGRSCDPRDAVSTKVVTEATGKISSRFSSTAPPGFPL